MDFKAGDKVLFLNEKGGGVISRVINEKIVHVAIEEGFEIPYAVTELLKIGAIGQGKGESDLELIEEGIPGVTTIYDVTGDKGRTPEGAYLAMVPTNQEKALEGELDIFLINNSPFEMLFGLYLNQSGTFVGSEYGFVPSMSKLFLSQINRAQITDWVNGLAQIMFFRPGKADPLKPVSAGIKFKPVALYKESSFSFEGVLRTKAFMVTLSLTESLEEKVVEPELTGTNIKLLNEKLNQGTGQAINQPTKSSFLDKHKVDDRIAEIDLHINELTENASGLSNADMLRLQMEYFHKCMEQAWVDKMVKVIFIHGVGIGTLKNEITRALSKIQGIEVYDAPYARYGMGATEVFFYRNQ
jgi:hypothetical protein